MLKSVTTVLLLISILLLFVACAGTEETPTSGGSSGSASLTASELASAETHTSAETPTSEQPAEEIAVNELANLLYEKSLPGDKSQEEGVPGERVDVRYLKKASDDLIGRTLTISVESKKASEILEPAVFAFYPAKDGGTVILLTGVRVTDEKTRVLLNDICFMLVGKCDIAGSEDFYARVGETLPPITVMENYIIEPTDLLSPYEALIAAKFTNQTSEEITQTDAIIGFIGAPRGETVIASFPTAKIDMKEFQITLQRFGVTQPADF